MSMIETTDKPRDAVTVFKSQIAGGENEFRAALPAHIPVERFMRVVTTAVTSNPDLMRADRRSLFEAATKAAQDGLLPDGRDGALVVYGNKIQWMPMIAGVLKKVRNSGQLASIDAQLVHVNDKFSYKLGVDPVPVHEPDWFGERGAVVGVYAVAKLKDGSFVVEIMSKKQVDEVRNVSRAKSNGPWVQWYGEMARKTVLRRLAKRLPMSTDLDDLIRRDDALYDFEGARDRAAPEITPPRTLAGRFDALASEDAPTVEHDPDTGEQISEHFDSGATADAPAQAAGDEAANSPSGGDDPAADNILDKARSKAMQGRKEFNLWFGGLSDADRDALQGNMKGLLAAAGLADGADE